MTLAQVQAAVALVAALIFTAGGLMVAVALLAPSAARRAQAAVRDTPAACIGTGVLLLAVLVVAWIIFRIPNPLAKLAGLALLLAIGGVLCVGLAGIALLTGARIGEMAGARTDFGMLVRGSVVLSLAAFFPLIGWWLFSPALVAASLGAGARALLARPRPATNSTPQFDVPGTVS
ncbi:MAG: hypothetical protein KGJ62_03575 [Armatimonadetes bacterium]|nr:hypothetical protein [Armatimonadota bacterium]MDE2206082.1 hypothetical protein [Armatimonadota bacterium]